jgi:hypothetical protein
MADFGARFTAGATLENWADPALGERPSRIHALPELPLKRRLALTDDPVEISAVVAGVEGPLDAALSGRTFFGWFTEYPGTSAPAVSSPPGQSSVRSFTPTEPGHYTYVLRRKGGGGIVLHVDAIDFVGG